ncbi:DUF1707 SHOCT-like domain-containing protein [Amycolatopsis sp. H20-H5]|uniref:DUF1707 SHOCT-like domain-containing protein n=1 Tax=Amycolatopsis sp. H20-H5 TaxID=3046309 RepID=UPI002DBE7809|nr:DUF1707 domain-containing protein [Amycolatopsis sp. H20-H5]MEC3974661.1 DUF1707 domain-containing protein [Amycolatopsis sp. H20-H5]
MSEEENTATETKPLNQRDLRVSDDEREHVVEVLQKAIGHGMLDLDEFSERTEVALAARTRGELNAVLADLPGLTHPGAQRSVPNQFTPQSPYAPPPQYGSYAPGQRLDLTAKYSSLVRSGPWLVPAAVSVRNKYGSTKLDFTEAQVQTPVVHIDLACKWGSVEIVIPEHAAVDINAITDVKYGSLVDRTNSNGRVGNPRYVLTGQVHGGSLVIRHPRQSMFG